MEVKALLLIMQMMIAGRVCFMNINADGRKACYLRRCAVLNRSLSCVVRDGGNERRNVEEHGG